MQKKNMEKVLEELKKQLLYSYKTLYFESITI